MILIFKEHNTKLIEQHAQGKNDLEEKIAMSIIELDKKYNKVNCMKIANLIRAHEGRTGFMDLPDLLFHTEDYKL